MTRLLMRAAALALVIVLSACGGGGDDSNVQAVPASFDVDTLSVEGVEGSPQSKALAATARYSSSDPIYFVVEAPDELVLDVQGFAYGDRLELNVTFRGDLDAGTHRGELLLHACAEARCTKELAGSPVRLPIKYEVKPNLQVQERALLHRAGREPAADLNLPVSVPTEAGEVVMQVANGGTSALDIAFDGSHLRVHGNEVRAGKYVATVTLQSATDPRYKRKVDVLYMVDAPSGGEQDLSVVDGHRHVNLRQGEKSVQRLKVIRPTWTNAWDTPQVGGTPGIASLRDLGGDEYELTIDASRLEPGSGYHSTVRFSAGPTGGEAWAYINLSIYDSFYVDGDFGVTFDEASGRADLTRSHAVLMADGASVGWTAVSRSPWLTLQRASGMTGVDRLQFVIDPALATQPEREVGLPIEITVDRPGTLPLKREFVVSNRVPTLQRISPAVLVGSSGRVFIEGDFPSFYSQLLQSGRLEVAGARLVKAQILSDSRFLSHVNVLALDLADAVPGTPVVVRVRNELQPSQLTLQVESPARVPTGYAVLPYAAYRPGQYAPGLDGFYFSGPDTVYRWGHDQVSWTLSQRTFAGLADVAPGPDDRWLYAGAGSELLALDARSLLQASRGSLNSSNPPDTTMETFDTQVPAGQRALAFAADGRVLAALYQSSSGYEHSIAWVTSWSTNRLLQELTSAPQRAGPGTDTSHVGPSTAGMVRSANGHTIVNQDAQGRRSMYRPDLRNWAELGRLPPGVSIVSVSDDSRLMVRSDGVLLSYEMHQGNLGSRVPASHVPGGYAVSADGRYGFVYGYRVALEGGIERARDATLWVVDLSDVPRTPLEIAPVLASIALPDAVGCTSLPIAGETCSHAASIQVAPGGGSAFVLGPRGIAAVALQDTMANSTAVPAAMRAKSVRGGQIRLQLHAGARP